MATRFADKVQRHITKGWRIEAKHLGQLWDVERGFQVVKVNQPFMLAHWRTHLDIEIDPNSFIYRARGDRTNLRVGDYLVGKDPASKTEASTLLERYVVISERIMRDNIVARTDEKCQVFRPKMVADFGQDNPYSFQTPNLDSQILAYNTTTGSWSFVDQPADPALITYCWANILRRGTSHYRNPSPVPLTVPPTGWTISLGLLPGVTLREGDIFIDSDGDWYRAEAPFYQLEGASLYQVVASRVRA